MTLEYSRDAHAFESNGAAGPTASEYIATSGAAFEYTSVDALESTGALEVAIEYTAPAVDALESIGAASPASVATVEVALQVKDRAPVKVPIAAFELTQ